MVFDTKRVLDVVAPTRPLGGIHPEGPGELADSAPLRLGPDPVLHGDGARATTANLTSDWMIHEG